MQQLIRSGLLQHQSILVWTLWIICNALKCRPGEIYGWELQPKQAMKQTVRWNVPLEQLVIHGDTIPFSAQQKFNPVQVLQ